LARDRDVLPTVDPPIGMANWLAQRAAGLPKAACWMLHPGAGARLRDTATPPTHAVLAVGPEGGFGDNDVAILQQAGFQALTLGPRILRTETAGLAAAAALQALFGDF
jgi:16S rRNA (uracil1498-N3)-methyltransferase